MEFITRLTIKAKTSRQSRIDGNRPITNFRGHQLIPLI